MGFVISMKLLLPVLCLFHSGFFCQWLLGSAYHSLKLATQSVATPTALDGRGCLDQPYRTGQDEGLMDKNMWTCVKNRCTVHVTAVLRFHSIYLFINNSVETWSFRKKKDPKIMLTMADYTLYFEYRGQNDYFSEGDVRQKLIPK